jgi:protein subunit release factor B
MYVPSSKKTKNSKEQIANNATHGYIAFQWSFHRKQNRKQKQKQNEGEKAAKAIHLFHPIPLVILFPFKLSHPSRTAWQGNAFRR